VEKILTLHPLGKKGVNISRDKYDVMRRTIMQVLKREPLTHVELTRAVERALRGKFAGSIAWYMECLKLDLEARKVIRRLKGGGQERYEIVRRGG